MTMSSEGSVSTSTGSRIRQFGLYRSIDARTEEFLRLSRKRQIKQGCACAAISTAITVTVVITVFFIYMEYGMNTESNQQSLGKSAWIGLINDSLASTFEEKFSKSKINFDRATIKLLPILIKALKQNRYLEKILEDYSSSSPAYDGRVTTEFTFKKDIFLNTKNLLKKPTSRLYTIEYKTSPVVFLKNPAKDVGYYAKIRKIRDYKRIMNYFEKMINDKVGISSNNIQSNTEPEMQTEKPIKNYLATADRPPRLKSLKTKKKLKVLRMTAPKNKTSSTNKDNFVSCNCPGHLSLLLSKIFSSIQRITPDDKITQSKPCKQKNKTKKKTKLRSRLQPDVTKIQLSSTTTKTESLPTKMKNVTTLQFSEFDNVYRKEETTLPTPAHEILDVNERKYNIFENTGNKESNLLQTTSTNNHIEATIDNDDEYFATHPMSAMTDLIESEKNVTITTEKIKLFEANDRVKTPQQNLNLSYPQTKVIDFEIPETTPQTPTTQKVVTSSSINNIESFTTTTDIIDKFKNNIYGIELLKSKQMFPTLRNNISFDSQMKLATIQNKKLNSSTTTANYDSTTQNEELKSTIPIYEKIRVKETTKPDPNIFSSIVENEKHISRRKSKLNMLRNQIIQEKEKKNTHPVFVAFENAAIEDEIEKIAREHDYPQEEYMKRAESTTSPLDRNITNDMLNFKNANANLWKIMKNNEPYIGSSSMLPQNRPSYLEIHRNSWKHEETNDYDTNIKYNVFDLL